MHKHLDAPPPLIQSQETGSTGLSAAVAAQRLRDDGPNALQAPPRRTLWPLVWELLRDPMLQLLLAAGAVYFLLGNRGDALMLLGFVAASAAISIRQEQRTTRVLDALRDLTSPRALVLRDGVAVRIAGTEVVRGDLLVLAEGDRIAADALVLRANDLCTDESLLSGESLPLAKVAAVQEETATPQQPGLQESAHVFAGSVVVGGQGLARVTATGMQTEIGKIGKSLAAIADPETPLRLQTQRMVRLFSIVGLGLSALVVVLFGLLRGDWLAGLLAGITLAMSLLPQEFLLILTVFMAMGAWRMSRLRVLARRSATIETLGSATVLCTDKTGTLTANTMAVAELVTPEDLAGRQGAPWQRWEPGQDSLSAKAAQLLEYAVLASERDPFDAMERAVHALAQRKLPASARHPEWQIVHEYSLTETLPVMTHVWRTAAGVQHVALKGAAEVVTALCQLPRQRAEEVAAQTQAMAAGGLRILGVARASWVGTDWPDTPDAPGGFAFEFLGLVAFADPLRPEVPAAIAECHAAGLRVLMITGDHPVTAQAIAAKAGLASQAPTSGATQAVPVVTGAEMDAMGDGALQASLRDHNVFARVRPQQKLRIVEALKANGQVVAMTGDGVNDAPSLKAAHVGIAMGGRGTDVAREASSLVLLDDNFGSIVAAVRLGRRIFDNLRKALDFVLAVHVPIAGLSLLPVLMGWPLILSPVHIAFLELLISPVCSVVFEAEAEEPDVMQRPPRDPAAALFSTTRMAWSFGQGLLVLLAVMAFYTVLQGSALADNACRALTFAALITCNVALILANRTRHGGMVAGWTSPNPMLWRTLLATFALLAAALWVAPLREVFRFGAAPLPWMAIALAMGVPVLLALEALKRLQRSNAHTGKAAQAPA